MQRPSWDTVVAETSSRFGRETSSVTLELQANPAEVHRARSFVRAYYPTNAGQLETVLLLVSELVTNAVMHGRSSVRLTMAVHEAGAVLISVSDESSTLPRQRAARRDEVDGRGLKIVGELADDWGFVPLGPTGGDGKIVWFRIEEQAATSERESAGSCDRGSPSI